MAGSGAAQTLLSHAWLPGSRPLPPAAALSQLQQTRALLVRLPAQKKGPGWRSTGRAGPEGPVKPGQQEGWPSSGRKVCHGAHWSDPRAVYVEGARCSPFIYHSCHRWAGAVTTVSLSLHASVFLGQWVSAGAISPSWGHLAIAGHNVVVTT